MARDDRWNRGERYRDDEERWQGGRDYRGRSRDDMAQAYGDPGRGGDWGGSHRYGPSETGFGESLGRDESRRSAGGRGFERGRSFNPDYGGHGGSDHGRRDYSQGGDYGRGGDYGATEYGWGRWREEGPSFSNDVRGEDWRGGYGHGHGNYSYGSEGGGWGREDVRSGGGVYGAPDYGRGYGYDSEEPRRRPPPRREYGWDSRRHEREGGHGGERSFWDRASDEVSSWFGDEEAERRRRQDEMRAEHRGRGPRGYARSDDRIREDVCDRLTEHPWVDASNIEVSVSGAEVTLSGSVTSRDQRRRAEDIAEQVSGVRHVQNNVRVAAEGGGGPGAGNAAAGGLAAAVSGRDPARSATSGSFTAPGERSTDEPRGAFSDVAGEALGAAGSSGLGAGGRTGAAAGASGSTQASSAASGSGSTSSGSAMGRNLT